MPWLMLIVVTAPVSPVVSMRTGKASVFRSVRPELFMQASTAKLNAFAALVRYRRIDAGALGDADRRA